MLVTSVSLWRLESCATCNNFEGCLHARSADNNKASTHARTCEVIYVQTLSILIERVCALRRGLPTCAAECGGGGDRRGGLPSSYVELERCTRLNKVLGQIILVHLQRNLTKCPPPICYKTGFKEDGKE